jgi:phospholipase C
MSLRDLPRPMGRALGGASVVALICCGLASASQSADVDQTADHQRTATPIKHVIVLIGENHSFDNIYATFVPHSGDKVKNLLSQGIVNADGSPGPHFDLAKQFKQVPVNGKFRQTYFIGLNANEKTPYNTRRSAARRTLSSRSSSRRSMPTTSISSPPAPPASRPIRSRSRSSWRKISTRASPISII